MPDQFADALERLDLNFENVGPDFDIFDLLHTVLGRMPTQLQMDITQVKLAFEQRQELLSGFVISQFVRQGRLVVQLRDVRGRFVTSGAAAIQSFIARL